MTQFRLPRMTVREEYVNERLIMRRLDKGTAYSLAVLESKRFESATLTGAGTKADPYVVSVERQLLANTEGHISHVVVLFDFTKDMLPFLCYGRLTQIIADEALNQEG